MNLSKKIGIFCLTVITVAYVYFSFFYKEGFNRIPKNNTDITVTKDNQDKNQDKNQDTKTKKHDIKSIKIFVTDSKGNLRAVSRKCDAAIEASCFKFAIKELIIAPTEWEKNKGLSSEIPQNTKILSIRENTDCIFIDLSSTFESGGGAESTYIRVNQLIKTSLANTKLPVYLYIDGKQADVIGGEGIMIKQPLSERSLDD